MNLEEKASGGPYVINLSRGTDITTEVDLFRALLDGSCCRKWAEDIETPEAMWTNSANARKRSAWIEG